MNKFPFIVFFLFFLTLLDLYVFQGVKLLLANFSPATQKIIKILYWSITALSAIAFLLYHFGNVDAFSKNVKMFILSALFINILSKVVFSLFLLIDDIRRFIQWLIKEGKNIFADPQPSNPSENIIDRSEFLVKAGAIVASVPLISLSWGIISGAHDYRVRKVNVPLNGLSSAFDGLRIIQISDIHSGSFWNKTAVKGGVEMINELKADLILFTGDLVNNSADEMSNWISVFSKLTAPLGIFSVLGNHDYGDYKNWDSLNAKRKNLQELIQLQKAMGWKMLNDENYLLEIEGEKIALIGVQNWGAKARFPKYGNLSKAYLGTENISTKILLSHDPSHWQAQVVPEYPDIDLTLSGHTHGMQFGVEVPGFKWSPVQYMYDEWAGLYSSGKQFLYVNRGFGYIGYPGRVGIPPEITLITLKRV